MPSTLFRSLATGWIALTLGVAFLSAQEVDPATRRPAAGSGSLASQLSGQNTRLFGTGSRILEWEWKFKRFVKLGGPEPALLEETVRLGFANRSESYVRVTYRATVEHNFQAGLFAGRKEVSYTIEKNFEKVNIQRDRFRTESNGPFKLVASDPPGHSIADFSTLGGIARGKNMVAVVDEAFRGENLFLLRGRSLAFDNPRFNGDDRDFPARIVFDPAL